MDDYNHNVFVSFVNGHYIGWDVAARDYSEANRKAAKCFKKIIERVGPYNVFFHGLSSSGPDYKSLQKMDPWFQLVTFEPSFDRYLDLVAENSQRD